MVEAGINDNQEDSLIFNKTSIQRGLFRSMSLRKYVLSIERNQSTLQDDIFMKPDPTKVIGMKHGSYDKLNDQGYVDEETVINNNEIIIGKVTPIQGGTSDTTKQFRDSSESYKSHAPGVIDRNYIGLQNQDGYESRKVLVRSERIPHIGDKFCLTSSADVLTYTGWKPIADVTTDDLVASLVDGKYIKYVNPIGTYKFTYDGDMYQLRSPHFDLDVTMDHELYVQMQGQNKFKRVPARDVMGTRYKMKKDGLYETSDISTLILPPYRNRHVYLPEREVNYDAFLEFLGVWLSDGCFNKTYKYINISCTKQRNIDHLIEIGRKLNMHIQMGKTNHKIYNIQLYNYIKDLNVGALNKYLPEYVWKLNQRQSRILLEALISGDGSLNNEGSACYYTSSRKLADDIMRLALHAGWSGSIKVLHPKGSYYKIDTGKGKQGCSNADALCVRIKKTFNETEIQNKNYEKTYKYNGDVYCLEVPSHVFMVRQNDKSVWTGNCSLMGQKGTIGILLDQMDMPFTKDGMHPDIILNPNAIPARMTIGQLMECLTGKAAAIQGMDADGTPFEDYNIDAVKQKLSDLGYNDGGYEELYNGMTGEKLKVNVFIGPTYYQRLKHLVLDKIHCLKTEGTEVLTLDGWKYANELTIDSKIATLKNNELVYEAPLAILNYPNHEGYMYYINNGDVDLAVTGNHRMYVSKTYDKTGVWTPYNFERADELIGKLRKYKKDADWHTIDYQFRLPAIDRNDEYIPERVVDMDAWLSFLGIWTVLGWTHKGAIKVAVNSYSIRNELCSSLEILGYKYHIKRNKLIIYDHQLYKYMKSLTKDTLPKWVFNLSKAQCRILIDAMLSNDDWNIYYTSSQIFADQVQQLCLHAGWNCNIITVKPGDIRLTVFKTSLYPVVNNTINDSRERYIYEKCPVFCLQVPSEVFYVRRNGKAVWTGNSRSRGPTTLLTRQPPEGRLSCVALVMIKVMASL